MGDVAKVRSLTSTTFGREHPHINTNPDHKKRQSQGKDPGPELLQDQLDLHEENGPEEGRKNLTNAPEGNGIDIAA
ncbi:MAG: hypothetical protein MUC92_00355 [Fimbriimonadaceae bacterium]|jgi:hypothetical protein|nr:hypothetical protein [Fimbriimonadaceae bacterium]